MDVDGVRVRPACELCCAALRLRCELLTAACAQLVAYVYQLVDGEVKVDKIEYVKAEKAAA